jgi:hypothetical protein
MPLASEYGIEDYLQIVRGYGVAVQIKSPGGNATSHRKRRHALLTASAYAQGPATPTLPSMDSGGQPLTKEATVLLQSYSGLDM